VPPVTLEESVNRTLDELCTRIDRLEAELAAANRVIQRRGASRRLASLLGFAAVTMISAAASWTVRAQTPTRMPGTADEQILSLLQRVTALERGPSRSRAPFEVVDGAGKVIFRVVAGPTRGFELLTAGGQMVATGVSLDTGGVFKTWSGDRSGQVSMGVNGKAFAGIVLRASEGGKPRGVMGITEAGRATVELSNDGGVVVSSLGVNATGAGLLELGNAGGNAMAQAGVLNGTGAGIFRTFPNGNPGAGLVGMPGTFIMGRGKE
jgi:hypothetical protein